MTSTFKCLGSAAPQSPFTWALVIRNRFSISYRWQCFSALNSFQCFWIFEFHF